MMATVIIRDPHIAGRDRWETNERAQASLSVDLSALRRVSARPLRSPLTTTGQAQRTQQRTHGNRTSTMATRTTTIRTLAAMFGLSGDMSELCRLT